VSVKRYPNAAIDFVDGEQVWADVVLAREYDALAARLAEAERLLLEWLDGGSHPGEIYGAKMIKATEAYLAGSALGKP
jgi:hypothetical protein